MINEAGVVEVEDCLVIFPNNAVSKNQSESVSPSVVLVKEKDKLGVEFSQTKKSEPLWPPLLTLLLIAATSTITSTSPRLAITWKSVFSLPSQPYTSAAKNFANL